MQRSYKIVLLGDTEVGKTSIINQHLQNSFNHLRSPTIGASYNTNSYKIHGDMMTLEIWDTGGEPRFRPLAPMYYRGAQAAIVVFSIDRKETFLAAKNWINEVRYSGPRDILLYLVGNKCDLDNHRQLSSDEGVAFAESKSVVYLETSAMSNGNIRKLFESIASSIWMLSEIDRLDRQGAIEMPPQPSRYEAQSIDRFRQRSHDRITFSLSRMLRSLACTRGSRDQVVESNRVPPPPTAIATISSPPFVAAINPVRFTPRSSRETVSLELDYLDELSDPFLEVIVPLHQPLASPTSSLATTTVLSSFTTASVGMNISRENEIELVSETDLFFPDQQSSANDTTKSEDSQRRDLQVRQLECQVYCVVCQEQQKTVCLFPCSHVCLCEHCSRKIDRACPICREPIEEKRTIFL